MQESLGTSHADTEVGRESGRDRVGVRLNPWVKVLVGVTVLVRDKYSAGMQHNVCDAQKSLCDASKGAREPDAESGCVMWRSCCMRRWRFNFYLEDCRRLRDRATWFGQVCFRAGAADHGSRKFASGKVQRHLRGCYHLRRSAVGRSRHSGHDILSVDSVEGVAKVSWTGSGSSSQWTITKQW